MTVADLVTGVFGDDLPIGLEAYDGSHAGPADPPATLVVRSPDAVRRLVTAPGELGFGRAYVAGDLDVEGDIFDALELREPLRRTCTSRASSGSTRLQARGRGRACAARRRRPKRRACAAAGTARSATRPRSRTTTTSRTTSTGSCSDRR